MAREMKNSGVQWIGEIPQTWKIAKVKDAFMRKNSKARQENPIILSLARSGVKVRDISTNEGQIAASYYEYNPVDIDDLLLNPMDLYSGANCSLSKVKGVISPAYINLRYKKDVWPRYYDYYFKTQYWTMAFWAHGKGISFDNRWTLSTETLMNYLIPVPAFEEQKAIADFLDTKCGEIDGLLADLDAEVKTLAEYKKSLIAETVTRGLNPNAPMKQSGIPWADTIPSHWKIQKGKYTFKLLQRPVKEDDGVITCFRDGEVTLRSNRREDGFTMSEKEYGYQGIEPGDLVVHGMDGFAGSIGISDSRGKGTPVLNVLDSDQNKRYLMYYLRNMAYGNVFLAMSTGIRVRSCDLSWKKLGDIRIVLPPVEEQEAITAFLDQKLEAIQEAITTKQDQIEKLKAYKASLIYEYVTGKKQVAL
jgi:type I restriction enzyme S subunit